MSRRLQKWLCVPTVWLLVASMALASVPRIDCLCPNGRTKVFGVGSSTACCQSASDDDAKQTQGGCCHKKVRKSAQIIDSCPVKPMPGETSIGRQGCTKTFVAPSMSVASLGDEEIARPSQIAASVLDIDLPWCDAKVPSNSEIANLQFPASRPPTASLIVLLQHFSI